MGQGRGRFRQISQRPFSAGVQEPAFVRQAEGAAVAVDQTQPQAVFEHSDMTRQCGLGLPGRTGRCPESAMANDEQEIS